MNEGNAISGERQSPGYYQEHLAEVRGQLVELLSGLDRQPRSLRLEVGDVRLELEWHEATASAGGVVAAPAGGAAAVSAAPQAASAPDDGVEYLRSPAVGVFYQAKEPGAEPFVSVGDTVEPHQQIGIIEAMKLMMPVEADRAGRIVAVVKADGEPVEFDEPLFAIEVGVR